MNNNTHNNLMLFTLLLFLVFFSHTSLSQPSPSVILDNTGSDGSLSIITDLATQNGKVCTRSKAINKKCNGIRFSDGKGGMQIIQNNDDGKLTSFIGLQNTKSLSTGNDTVSDSVNKTKPLSLFPLDNSHLLPLEKYRAAADKISQLTTSLPAGTYGTISFKKFISNVASSTPMYGIVRVEVPLYQKDANSRYRFCGENNCPGTCGPRQGRALKSGETICGHKITDNSKMNVFGSLMIDFVDAKNNNTPLEPLELRQNKGLPKHLWYCLALPVNVNPANASKDNSFMNSILKIRNVSGSNICSASGCANIITKNLPFKLVPQESKDEYLYKMGTILDSTIFGNLPKDQQFNLLLPSGYENAWEIAFNKLGITPSIWESYGFKTSSDTSGSSISKANIRSATFEDIPAVISTGGVLSLVHRANISGLIYAPEAFELLQVKMGTKHALQYINGAILVKNGFYIGANGADGNVTIMSNNKDNYSNILLQSSSGSIGKVTRTPSKSIFSISSTSIKVDINGNFPADDIFSPVINEKSHPGRHWIEIKPK